MKLKYSGRIRTRRCFCKSAQARKKIKTQSSVAISQGLINEFKEGKANKQGGCKLELVAK